MKTAESHNAGLTGKVEPVEQARNAIYECSKELGVAATFDLLAHSIANASAALASEYARGRKEMKAEADVASNAAVWQTKENEERAISKGSPSYDFVFRYAAIATNVGEAIAALPEKGGEG